VGGVTASGVSSAKTNDLKPLLGEALAPLLAPYDWWGYLQEDLLVGDLANRFFSPSVLASADVISPYPVHASATWGVAGASMRGAYISQRGGCTRHHWCCWL
jgi:hypothetical protein